MAKKAASGGGSAPKKGAARKGAPKKSAPAPGKAAPGAGAAAPTPPAVPVPVPGPILQGAHRRINGLRNYALFNEGQPEVTALQAAQGISSAERSDASRAADAAIPPSTAAHSYLVQALASAQIPQLTAAPVNGQASEFKSVGTETIPFTGTTTVKFRQFYNKIPVYGSLVTVELDEKNQLVGINSAIGEPANIDALAKVSPAQAMDVVRKRAGYEPSQPLDAVPHLNYYFDATTLRWRLVYIAEDVFRNQTDAPRSAPSLYDYIVDAHSGDLVAEMPRTQTVQRTGAPGSIDVADELGKPRTIGYLKDERGAFLNDPLLNVQTYDFGFRMIVVEKQYNHLLPGDFVAIPPEPWHSGAVSAHANATVVATFYRMVLGRNGPDNQGMPFVSSINCLYDGAGQEWHNAMWIGTQMVYGQRKEGDRFVSYARDLDIVAHEITHGVTNSSSRLEYSGQSGALNESYSDIMGAIVANFDETDLAKWNWTIGEGFGADQEPIRDLSDPKKFDQPDHMKNYAFLAENEAHDNGGVHTNSGIHNKAAYNIITAKDAAGKFLFDAQTVARLFYLALTQYLSRTSGFSDSLRGVQLAARSLFRNDANRQAKLDAIAKGFADVGIA